MMTNGSVRNERILERVALGSGRKQSYSSKTGACNVRKGLHMACLQHSWESLRSLLGSFFNLFCFTSLALETFSKSSLSSQHSHSHFWSVGEWVRSLLGQMSTNSVWEQRLCEEAKTRCESNNSMWAGEEELYAGKGARSFCADVRKTFPDGSCEELAIKM